jgi:hypothetical protein
VAYAIANAALAQHGFVEEAEGGKGRQRPWQVPGLGFRWDEEHASPSLEGRRAAQALSDVMMGRAIDRLRESQQRAPEDTEEWRAARSNTEMVAWLTADELAEMNNAINAVLDRHVERLTDPTQRPPNARLCEFVAWGVPTYFPGVETS